MCYDLDAISLALIILSDKYEDVDSAMDEMLRYRNDDGIVMGSRRLRKVSVESCEGGSVDDDEGGCEVMAKNGSDTGDSGGVDDDTPK